MTAMRAQTQCRAATNMILRSVSLLLAGISALALSACKSMDYDDPPRGRFNDAYLQTTPPPGLVGARESVAPVVPTNVEPPRVTPPPVPSASITEGAREFPVGTPVAGKPGFVTSPYKPYAGYVDVRGFSPGEQVKCPYSGKIFLVP
jgi:hypothetical protein